MGRKSQTGQTVLLELSSISVLEMWITKRGKRTKIKTFDQRVKNYKLHEGPKPIGAEKRISEIAFCNRKFDREH